MKLFSMALQKKITAVTLFLILTPESGSCKLQPGMLRYSKGRGGVTRIIQENIQANCGTGWNTIPNNDGTHTCEISKTTTKPPEPSTTAFAPTTTACQITTTKPCLTTGGRWQKIGSDFFWVFPRRGFNWSESNDYCCGEGLIMAEPKDPKGVVGHLKDTGKGEFWLGARGNGINHVWISNGTIIPNSSALWRQDSPGAKVTSKDCLRSDTRATPYIAVLCTQRKGVLCQCP